MGEDRVSNQLLRDDTLANMQEALSSGDGIAWIFYLTLLRLINGKLHTHTSDGIVPSVPRSVVLT
jgi:hypothetical protein